MDVKQETIDGIDYITIKNDMSLTATFCSLGAAIYRVQYDEDDMVLSPKNLGKFCFSPRYYGKTVGRIAGRVKNGLLTVNEKTYHLDLNEGNRSLHGGYNSIAYQNFQTKIDYYEDGIGISFTLTTKDKESGYNGEVDYNITYYISADGDSVNIYHKAKPSEDTYINLTNHTYFNLGYKSDVFSHKLRIRADKVSTFDEDFCINGMKDVKGTAFDFNELKEIGKDISDPILHNPPLLDGYDHRFLFNHQYEQVRKVVLEMEKYRLDVFTDYDAVHVYTISNVNDEEYLDGSEDCLGKGIALECMNFEPQYMKKDSIYYHKTVLTFTRIA